METHSSVSSPVDERILFFVFFKLIIATKSNKVSNYIIYLFFVYLQCCSCKTNFLVIKLVKRSYIIALPEFQCNKIMLFCSKVISSLLSGLNGRV